MSLKSIDYSRGKMLVLDQLELPHRSIYIDIGNSQDAWSVIRSMQVRGAPLIAITAALGLAVEAEKVKITITSLEEARSFLLDKMAYLRTSRPTAVNLFTATDQLTALVNELASRPSIQAVEVFDGFIEAAERMLEEDINSNRSIGSHGAQRILDIVLRDKIRVLTICNTGSLATAGFGTALGVVRSLHEQGRLEHVYACETRPYNQGARLTAYEIVQDNLPGTLITDSMASTLMSVKGVDCVIVGADRVAANGDTANKVGTYQLAIAAQYHGVPFFVAAPSSTFDLSLARGDEIPIEERSAAEVLSPLGTAAAPEGARAFNPAFDVTPARLIRGIITEHGICYPPFADSLAAVVARSRAADAAAAGSG
jgi:methylthioribose-1-phosphate isomerase